MRQLNWQGNLSTLLKENKENVLDYGTWDCGIFSAKIAKAVLVDSSDYFSPFRGKYSTAIGSMRALKKAGFSDLREYLIHCCGDPIGPSHAWRGDIAFYEGCAGVNLGSYNLLLGVANIGVVETENQKGFVSIPRLEVQEYFKVR